ncbi:MAG: glutamate racemase, partial [Muribaculaceae bacterium]|nr:glutamate racemase [Muribaculaceae bacterium]
HYPMLKDKIVRYVSQGVIVVPQGEIVAQSLADYLRRHPEMESKCAKDGRCDYYTTESSEKFSELASMFMGEYVSARHIDL